MAGSPYPGYRVEVKMQKSKVKIEEPEIGPQSDGMPEADLIFAFCILTFAF